ncbi:MAG: glutamine synthetase [Gammaproteobacteria bacterium]|nr:glutamine synthetase [Gammaproteobacteria bacterium]
MTGEPDRSLARWAGHHGLETLVLLTPDLNGQARGKHVAARRLQGDPAVTINLPDLALLLDYGSYPVPRPPGAHGWWPELAGACADRAFVADPATARILPWAARSGLVIGELADPASGRAYAFMPRALLAAQVARAAALGYTVRAALELEFTLHTAPPSTPGELPPPLWPAMRAWDVATQARHAAVLEDLRATLEAVGVGIETWALEAGPGQVEMNLAARDALAAADEAFLLKYAVKAWAARHDRGVTFMAQAAPDGFGNGQHVHLSLWRDGANTFADPARPGRPSAVMAAACAGLLAHLDDYTLVWAPTTNAYRRFQPGHLVGLVRAWGEDNRSCAVRALAPTPAATRLELRTPGADACPHLVLAAALAAALDGLEQGLAPPPPVHGDACAEPMLARVPADLPAALARFETSTAARRALGADFVRFFAAGRRVEQTLLEAAAINAAAERAAWERARYFDTA